MPEIAHNAGTAIASGAATKPAVAPPTSPASAAGQMTPVLRAACITGVLVRLYGKSGSKSTRSMPVGRLTRVIRTG
jgi:hypothetical protein